MYLTHMVHGYQFASLGSSFGGRKQTSLEGLLRIIADKRVNGTSNYIAGLKSVACFTSLQLGINQPKKASLVSFIQTHNRKNPYQDNYFGIAIPVEKLGNETLRFDSRPFTFKKVGYLPEEDEQERQILIKVREELPSVVDQIPSEDKWMFKRGGYYDYSFDKNLKSFKWEEEYRKSGFLEIKNNNYGIITKTIIDQFVMSCYAELDKLRIKPAWITSFEARVGVGRENYMIPDDKSQYNEQAILDAVQEMKNRGKQSNLQNILIRIEQNSDGRDYGGCLLKDFLARTEEVRMYLAGIVNNTYSAKKSS